MKKNHTSFTQTQIHYLLVVKYFELETLFLCIVKRVSSLQ